MTTKKLKITNLVKQQEQLLNWFNKMNIPPYGRKIWSSTNDGSGFDAGETQAMHDAFRVVNYRQIPDKFNGGYVLDYTVVGIGDVELFVDPWDFVEHFTNPHVKIRAIIDPSNPLRQLTKEQFALLIYRIKEDGDLPRPKRVSALKRIVKAIQSLSDEWEEVDEDYKDLKPSKQAFYLESVVWVETETTEVLSVGGTTFNPFPGPITGGTTNQVDLRSNVTDAEILKFLADYYVQHRGDPSCSLHYISLELSVQLFYVYNVVNGLLEKGWVSFTRISGSYDGIVSLTTNGRKIAGVSTS